MAHVQQETEFSLEDPMLVEGLPGVGLVGKIAADHLVEELEMEYVAGVRCEGLPSVAVYRGESSTLLPPVRIYASEAEDLLVLQSDVPVSPSSATEFAGCITAWLDSQGATPLYLSGLSEESAEPSEVYGIATDAAAHLLDEAGVVPPRQSGLVSGPTGALLAEADERGLPAVGLIVPTESKFPDPAAARTLIEGGVGPLAGLDVDTSSLVEHAEEIRQAREQLAKQLAGAEDESSQAQPIRGFQ